MALKSIQCREHGGNFTVEARRGRPPVKCGGKYPLCDMAPGTRSARKKSAEGVAKAVSRTLKGATPKPARKASQRPRQAERTPAKVRERVLNPAKPTRRKTEPREAAPVVVRHNPSIALAKKAKDQLDPLGWSCTGRAWFGEDGVTDEHGDFVELGMAELTARRGDEFLRIVWQDGKAISQDYSLWNPDKVPAANGKPKSRLPWNPDEMSDAELAAALMGHEIEWWNRIKSGKEKALVSTKQIKVEHVYYGAPDEDDENQEPKEPLRMVSFVDPHGGGWRSFHVEALMKVSL